MPTKYLRRTIDAKLEEWKISPYRKPLLVRGARQIGKSSSIRHLGLSFEYFIEVNFETRPDLTTLFQQEHDVNVICERLSMLYSTPVIPGKTLIFLDEIQTCREALKSLWFFKEALPELHIIAAGSLLEFALKKMPSYGVGRVSSIFMYPMGFTEFLWAMDKDSWEEAVSNADFEHPLFEALHKDLVSLYRTFLMVGGMPASVKAWVETKDFRLCTNELADIQQTYYDDFEKYDNEISPELLRNTLQSVVMQTGNKFIYSKLAGGYSIYEIKMALKYLKEAGLIKEIRMSAANGLPLGAEINEKFTRYIYLDTGLLLRVLDLNFGGAEEINALILAGNSEDLVNKGKVAEVAVGWELVKNADCRHRYELYYWENIAKGATSEVDFIIPSKMKILPIEVKSGVSGKMKSLRLFMEKKNIATAIRTSLENFGQLFIPSDSSPLTINILPLYAVGRLTHNT